MTKPIYALTPDELRAKARERERLRDAARANLPEMCKEDAA